jgi:hypothetical protein
MRVRPGGAACPARWEEVADAISALAIAPGAPWANAVVASAVLVRTAYGSVSAVTGKALGLSRTSYLARDGFGVGPDPNGGTTAWEASRLADDRTGSGHALIGFAVELEPVSVQPTGAPRHS